MARGNDIKGTGGDPQFAAFISYSHADAIIAAKLQRRLEKYRLPKHVALSRKDQQAHLGRIFRDREDLAAADNLSDAIRAALSKAETLIVLCSPEAAASRWVAAEIALFRKLHPQRPVFAALVRGDPANAFPAALTEGNREPLAADLRPEGDGLSLGFLKIVAGIAGVPLDNLVQRDAQRRIRRVTAITLGALAAMLAMGVMTAFALSARNEAARQRASAEGLVEYMLTDLREKLEAVGKIDVMRGVNKRAMDYYSAQQDLSSLSSESLLRRARVIEAMGRDDENAGNVDLAVEKFVELDRTTTALLQTDPENPDIVFRKAESQNRLALIAHTQGKTEQALSGFQRSREKLVQIQSAHGKKSGWLKLAALVYGNICASFVQTGRPVDGAITHCKQAIRHAETLIAREPEKTNIQYDLVFHYGWLADAYAKANRPRESAEADQNGLSIIARLKALDPQNMLWLEQEMQVHGHIAQRMKSAGQSKQHAFHYQKASAISRTLFAREPQNAVWRRYYEKYSNQKPETQNGP